MSNDGIGITVLGSGSSGNCTIIQYGGTAIMVDAGFSARETRRRMEVAGLGNLHINAILVTHDHDDHVKGLRVCSNALDAPIFASMKCAQFLRSKDEQLRQMATFAPGGTFDIGSITICPFSIPHDACDPVAFSFVCGNRKIAVATDMGYASSMIEYHLRECTAMVLESNHDINMLAASSRPWNVKQRILSRIGHLSNDASAQLISAVAADCTKHVILAHISRECNQEKIAFDNARACLDAIDRQDIALQTAHQDCPIATVWC